MAQNESIANYYNLYDETKGFTEILFRAGKILQSKELNEMQSILKNQIKKVGDTVLTDGDIIEGCQLVIADNKKSITLTKGKVYLNGNVHDIPDTTLSITGQGTETIGVILKEMVITPDEDTDLNDIATGFDNYNQDGAFRLKEYVEVTLNDYSSTIIYTLVDGMQLSINTAEDLTQLDKINSTLARRTFDESGNYKVSGLTITDKGVNDTNYIYVSVEAGKAYVRGYEVSKETAQTVRIARATSTREQRNEVRYYLENSATTNLGNSYVLSIDRINANTTETVNITHNTSATMDVIPSPGGVGVAAILKVFIDSDNVSKEFVLGTDWEPTSDYKGIRWLAGDNPGGGTYSITYTYAREMVNGSDYILGHNDDWTTCYITWLPNGVKPNNGAQLNIDYTYNLCRRDTISLDKDGNLIVTEGQSDILTSVESPSVDTNHVLVLGSVLVKPHSDEVGVINNNTKTIRMLDLYNMLKRINDLEYNQAVTALDQEAATGESATELKGIQTDGFMSLDKSDLGHKDAQGHSDYSASIDLDNNELTLPFNTLVSSLIPDETENYRVAKFGRLLTTQYSETILLSQGMASDTIRINSYNAFPKSPSIKLSPEVDNWVDTDSIVLQGGVKTQTVVLRRWWYHKNESWAQAEKAIWQSYGFADGGANLGWANGSATTTTMTTTDIVSSAILYMRQRVISVSASNFIPNAEHIVLSFNGTIVPLTPVSAAYQGGSPGELKADANGYTYGSFTVPANTMCGTVEVQMYSLNMPSLVGLTSYTAEGSKQTTTQTVWTVKTTARTSDPIAQSFQFERDRFITGVGIYFKDKNLEEPITVQIRNMINGYPGTTVYAEKVIGGSNCRTSSVGTQETKIVFDNPVYCNANEQYCFTILSDSDVDSLWIAETNQTDIYTKEFISKNPYLNGTMFSSSNAVTWTAHQSQDLKFNLYGTQFATTGSVTFVGVTGVNIDRLMIMSDESIPTGCAINWQYSINGDDWLPIETYDDRDLSKIATSVKIRCNLVATEYVSPAIALDSLILCGFVNESSGVYIGKNLPVTDGFNTIKIVFDANLPADTNCVVKYATDMNGYEWNTIASPTESIYKSYGYSTYTYEAVLPNVATNYRVRLELSKNNTVNRPSVRNLKSIMKRV